MSNSQHQHGMSRLGVLITVLLIAAGVFVGSQVIPFYYSYYELKGQMEAQAARASVHSDDAIKSYLWRVIKKLEIPELVKEDIKINRFSGKIVIEVEYDEVLWVDLGDWGSYDLHVFSFNPRVEQEY